jgi:transcriptional regulator with XRE-family HTH domain
MESLGERLKYIRTSRGLTQKHLGELAGVGERRVQYYESGSQKPGFDVLVALSDALDVSLDYLAGRTRNHKVYDTDIGTRESSLATKENLNEKSSSIDEQSIFINAFSSNISTLREINALTQKEVATYLKVTEQHVKNLEAGASKPGFDTLNAMADLYNVSIDYLCGRYCNENEMAPLTKEEAELLRNYRRLQKKAKESLRYIIGNCS